MKYNKSLKLILAIAITTNAYGDIRFKFSRNISSRLARIKRQKDISPESLGTQKKNFYKFSTFSSAIAAAIPTYEDAELSKYLTEVYRQSRREKQTLNLNSYEQMQRTFGLPLKYISSKIKYVESDQQTKNGPLYAYGISPKTGEAFLQKNVDQIKSMPMENGERLIPIVSRSHDSIITRLGISQRDFLFKETSILAIGSQSKKGDKGTVLADSFLTYGLRKYKGLMVEESFIKVYSKNTKVFEGLDISWPVLRFHPQMKNFKLKNKKELMKEVLGKISKTQQPKSLINVRMAVVLRPVKINRNGSLVFIPSVKVGVYSKSGEAGNLFYVDLSKTKFRYINEDVQEASIQNT